jgi:hypothetical protein
MATSFELLSSHLRVGFTHSNVHVRKLSVEILVLVFNSFPALARKDNELYESFLMLMKSQKKPAVPKLLKEVVQGFRTVYEGPDADEDVNCSFQPLSDKWTVDSLEKFSNRFYFPALYGSNITSRTTTDTSWLDKFL